MVFARSMDRGATFSKAAKAGTGSWKIAACPMDGGALSPLGSNVTAVWRREDKVYKAIVPGQEVLLGTGEQPWAATSAAGTYFVWVKKRGGPLLLLGPGAETPVELDPVASDPVVVTASDGPDLALVAWESGDAEHPKIVVARVDAAAAPK